MDLISASAPGVLAALAGTYAAYFFAMRGTRDTELQATRREASADLAAPIRDLRTMTRRRGRVDVTSAEVSSAVLAWTEAFDRQGHRLPQDWQHVGRSVRAATGEVFGGVVMADLSPDMAEYPLAAPEVRWQDYADDYLTYVVDAIVRWGDGQRRSRPLENFDRWLQLTGRREVVRR